MSWLKRLMGLAPEIPSPPGLIKFEQLDFEKTPDNGHGTLKIEGLPTPVWIYSNPHDTDSMDGAFDVGHSPIITCNKQFIKANAKIGAWITWAKDGVGRFHQIVEIDNDYYGWYCRTKGLNLAYKDPQRIRYGDITGIAIGIIWTELSGKVIFKV